MRQSLLLVGLLGITSVVRAQSEEDVSAARLAFEEGIAAYEARDFAEAAEDFERAYELTRDPDVAFNTARAYERAGEREEAARYYRLYLRDAEASVSERAQLETLIAALEREEQSDPARSGESNAPETRSDDDAGLHTSPGFLTRFSERFTPRFEELVRVSALFTMGLGGGLRFSADPDIPLVPEGRSDLEPTFGGAVRGEVFVARYLGIGAEVGLASYAVEEADERELTVDVDLWLRPRLPFVLSDTVELEIYVGIPIGFTLYRPSNEDLENFLGFNFGALGGLSFAPLPNLAVFVEVGWRHRQVYDELTIFQTHDLALKTDQAHLALGVSLRL